MKDNLEKAFKNSLEEYEVPYDPKAWDAVNAELDAKASGGNPVLSNVLKWGLATALLGIVVTASYFLWYNNPTETEKSATTAIERKQQESAPTTQKTESSEAKEITTKNNESLSTESPQESADNSVHLAKEEKVDYPISNSENTSSNNSEQSGKIMPTETKDTPTTKKETPKVDKHSIASKSNYIAGTLSSTVICINDEVTISNPSATEIVRFKHNERRIELTANKKYTFTPTASMVINFINNKNELIEAQYIKVNDLPTPSFIFDANIYEKGLPVVLAKADGDYKHYTWTFDQTTRSGATVKHHFFDKGKYDITLNVEDANGCKAEKSKTVRIHNKYNLMAVDAFKPNGSDVRNRTFMPYSLTERDVRFELTIIDPIDNGVVFSTNDADQPWDGKDQRTGKMTASNKTFIWKVQIFNPVLNERPIYAGTIVHN